MIGDILASSLSYQHVLVILAAAVVCAIVIAIAPMLPRLYGSADIAQSVQAVHTRPTPRVGGLGVITAMIAGLAFAPADLTAPYPELLIAASLIFSVGLLEDLGFSVAPARRLLAAMAASFVMVVLLDTWLPRVGIPVIDQILGFGIVGIPFTLFATAGVANGFNLIDGVNGLAAVTCIVAATAFAQIAEMAGYFDMVHLCLILAAGSVGFLFVNFPFGMIFLGDAGAYTMGFLLSWFGISILVVAPEVSPWAILLCVFWPVADTLLAIYRRRQRKCSAMAPDRLHVHQMVMRTLELCVVGRSQRNIANPLTTVVLTPFVAMPPTVAVMFWNDDLSAFLATLGFAVLFVTSYRLTPKLARRLRTRRISVPGVSA